MHVVRAVTVRTPPALVFEYLADFTTTERWDPGTLRTRRLSGDGGVGTKYQNVSRFLGRRTELEYVVEELRAPRLIRLRGHNATVTACDTMELSAAAGGTTRVRYRADFDFHGSARLMAPLLWLAVQRLGTRAASQLRHTLDSL